MGSSEVCVMRGWECERVRHEEFRGMCYEGAGVRERVRHGEFRGMCYERVGVREGKTWGVQRYVL